MIFNKNICSLFLQNRKQIYINQHKNDSKKNPEYSFRILYEPTTGFEPVTSSLPRKHSTPELSRPKKKSHSVRFVILERKTGVEPATFSLEG